MTRKIISILVCMLMCVTVSAVTGAELFDENNHSLSVSNVQNRDIWDVQFQYDVGGDTGSLYLAGVVFDGTNFYVPEFNSATIYRFDHDGVYLDSFTISGVPNLVDLTYDGTYTYGMSTTGTTIYEMDMAGHTLVSSIPISQASYNIAYDADADGGNGGFWIGQWQTHLTLVSRSGAVLDSISPVPDSMFGLAWDNVCEITGYNGPFLWIFTGTSTGGQGVIKVIDLDTKAIISSVQHNVATDLGMGIAGGLEFTTEWADGFATLYGIIQGADPVDDYLFGYEICTTNEAPDIPDAPDGPSSGIEGQEYTFEATTTDPEGEDIYYWFDWGDGENSGWVGPYASGETGSASHIWDAEGTYDVTVKAKDVNGRESGFSAPSSILIESGPMLEIYDIKGGLFYVTAKIKNVGADEATNVDWTIHVDGAWIGADKADTIASIPAGQEVEVKSKLILGFSTQATFTLTADIPESSASEMRHGLILLFYIKVNVGG